MSQDKIELSAKDKSAEELKNPTTLSTSNQKEGGDQSAGSNFRTMKKTMLPKIDINNQIVEIIDDDSPTVGNRVGLKIPVEPKINDPLIKMVSMTENDQT